MSNPSEAVERCGCDDQVRLERAIRAVLDILGGQKLHPETTIERILREALRVRS